MLYFKAEELSLIFLHWSPEECFGPRHIGGKRKEIVLPCFHQSCCLPRQGAAEGKDGKRTQAVEDVLRSSIEEHGTEPGAGGAVKTKSTKCEDSILELV